MTKFGVSIEKQVGFRGGIQPFANVYYYELTGAPTTEIARTDDLVNALVVIEKAIHSTDVSYIRGRCWYAGGTKAENQMVVDKALTGTGSLTAHVSMDKERAVLIQISAGVDSRGRPVKLRKWFHVCATAIGGVGVANNQLAQTAQLDATQRAAMAAVGENLKQIEVGVGGASVAELIGPSGRPYSGAAACHPYLEHHQLGDQWRD